MDVKKKLTATALTCASVVMAAWLVGCGVQQDGADKPAGDTTAAPTYQELIEMYPDEYNSAMTHKADEEGEDNSHAGFQALMETPAVRSSGGAIIREVAADDPEKTDISMSCVACKSSGFNALFAEHGYDAFIKTNVLDDAAFATLDGQYWDCYGCHTWENGELKLSANMAYANEDIFPTLAAFYDNLNPEEAVCGQCHNVANARNFAKTEEQAKEADPYRYGLGMEEIYKSLVEGGIYGTDEETGIIRVKENHPQIEIFQDSVHQSMGLSCVDCHMTETPGEDGNAFTSHNASGSVAENDAAMEKCLTCHKTQSNVENIDDMRAFLKEKQTEQVNRQTEVEAELAKLYDAILNQVKNGTDDEASLQEAKDKYSLAAWLVWEQQGNLNDPADGAQIAHDPAEMRSMLERANVLVEEGLALLA